jgi:hypothetical protein
MGKCSIRSAISFSPARNLTTFAGKAKLHCTLVAIGLLECNFLAYKFGQLNFGSLHEALARRLCNPFWLNQVPLPESVTLL